MTGFQRCQLMARCGITTLLAVPEYYSAETLSIGCLIQIGCLAAGANSSGKTRTLKKLLPPMLRYSCSILTRTVLIIHNTRITTGKQNAFNMLTNDKSITTPEYWDKVYTGQNENAKVDASNTKRPANAFDRFGWVAGYAEGPHVLGVASGHAHIEKKIKATHPEWVVVASDQTKTARDVANYYPYWIMNAYNIQGFTGFRVDTIICCQAMEYMDDQDRFLKEAQRVARKLLITVPIGEMAKWSQLRI